MSELDIDAFVDNMDVVEKPVLRRNRSSKPKTDPRVTAKVEKSYKEDCTLGVVVPGNVSRLLANFITNGARELGISVQLTYTFEGNDGEEKITTKGTEVPKDDRQVLLRFQGRDKVRSGFAVRQSEGDSME